MNQNDAKLQKVTLGPDWIDLSFGEPRVIMQALFRQIDCVGSSFRLPTIRDLPTWEYQPAAGTPDLTLLLEKRYDSKVVVCNGAKQALSAAFYSFKQDGIESIYYDNPFYPANPSLIELAGLTRREITDSSSLLITSPNNPDGKNYQNTELLNFDFMKPMIHDAAYYTDIYLPDGQIPIPVGDIQVFSMSKMYGISGLRIGYAVARNEKYYKAMVEYVEMTTAGVSTASQEITRQIELFFKDHPSAYRAFVKEARESLRTSREIILGLNPDVLEVLPAQSNSMFAWCKKGPALDTAAAKVYILPGELFGQPGMMRINIAHPPDVIREAVKRLNENKSRS